PRLSPDCTTVAFAAIPPTTASAAPLRRLLQPVLPAAAEAHGSPRDLWLVAINGSRERRLTSLNEDEPFPVWLDDSQIVFLGTTGLYRITSDGRALKHLASGAVHGQLALTEN